jgi:signal transduction histidine kinase
MYYNTALSFIVGGLGFLAVGFHQFRWARVSGSVVALFGLGTLGEYLSGVNFGIDQLFMSDFHTAVNPYPGRMSPMSASNFVLCGAVLLSVQNWSSALSPSGSASASAALADDTAIQRLPPRVALVVLLGVVLIVSGLMNTVLYLFHLITVQGWGRVVNMAPHTALCFILLGTGAVAMARRANQFDRLATSLWLPILGGVAVVTVTLVVCYALLAQEQKHMERTVAVVARGVQHEIQTLVDTRILTLVLMARRWGYGEPPQAQWQSEAESNLRYLPGSRVFVWIDAGGQVRWITPHGGAETLRRLQDMFTVQRQRVEVGQDNRSATIATDAGELVPGEQSFTVFAPVWTPQQFAGFMVGVFTFEKMLQTVLTTVALDYGVRVFDGDKEIYRRASSDGRHEAEWADEAAVDMYGHVWRVRVWPQPEALRKEGAALPELILTLGFLIAVLVTRMIALRQTARRRAAETATAYLGLTRVMAERERAQAALQTAHAELEVKVRGRTAELAEANASLLQENVERKRAEAALARQARELARSNTELEHFAHVASHDLQEPLRKIRAFGDRLKSKCGDALNAQGRDYLERMQAAAARMQTLIDDLLMLSRVTSRPQPFARTDLTQVAHTIASDLEVRIQQVGATVRIEQLPTIEADPVQIGQLFQNLIGNALKFHRPGEPPVITIRGALVGDGGAETPPTGAAPCSCRLWVQDNGIGFDEKYLGQIFQPFQRLVGRAEYEGTGMGLAICKKIVERHGGAITAQSVPGQGTTFVVTLPVHHVTTEAALWENGASPSPL